MVKLVTKLADAAAPDTRTPPSSPPDVEKKNTHVPNWYLDTLLLGILYFESGLVFYAFRNEPQMLLILFIALVAVAMLVKATKWLFRIFGLWLSRSCLQLVGNPLKKKTTLKKWCDQSWQLMAHVGMALFEYYIIKDETWWQDTKSIWVQDPEGFCTYQGGKLAVKMFFVVEMALWFYTAFSCKYVEEIRKDHIVMMTHHVVTIACVLGAYLGGYLAISITLLFLHDVSDIPLDLLKMANYLKLEGRKGKFIVEILFVALIFDWYYFRIFLYPYKFISSTYYESRSQCPSPNNGEWFPERLPGWLFMTSLLVLLWFLHIWWGFLILRLLLGVLTKGSHQTAEDEYEGASSDSEKEN